MKGTSSPPLYRPQLLLYPFSLFLSLYTYIGGRGVIEEVAKWIRLDDERLCIDLATPTLHFYEKQAASDYAARWLAVLVASYMKTAGKYLIIMVDLAITKDKCQEKSLLGRSRESD